MTLTPPPNGRVAVIGAGVFGVTAAVHLARDGWRVGLFEAQRSIMVGATGNNVFRLHRGYHYPRSLDTARETKQSVESFVREYGAAVIRSKQHLYAISKFGSRVSAQQFLEHCRLAALEVDVVSSPLLKTESVELVIEALEWRMDPVDLRAIGQRHIADSGVELFLETEAGPSVVDDYDYVVLCGNAKSNALMRQWGMAPPRRQFEVCEVAIMKGAELGDTDIVVMDGPFNSLSPYGRREGLHILYDVEHSVHHRFVSDTFEPPEQYRALLSNPAGEQTELTAFESMLKTARQYVNGLDNAEYFGSLWSVRTVLADVDATDARPTIVNWVAPTVMTLFSGKLVTAVTAAESVVTELRARSGIDHSEAVVPEHLCPN
ncbi:FAD-dependent oxidoreductase [Mycobacterium sp. LTG2003]